VSQLRGLEIMAEKLDDKEMINIDELLMVQMIQIDTISQLLIEKGGH